MALGNVSDVDPKGVLQARMGRSPIGSSTGRQTLGRCDHLEDSDNAAIRAPSDTMRSRSSIRF